jgi:hypothetical protein
LMLPCVLKAGEKLHTRIINKKSPAMFCGARREAT